jgi:hypothetical protein
MRIGDRIPGPGRRRAGTRFRLFPQPPFSAARREPETVWLSPPAGSLGPGPSDGRMYVVDPIGKRWPYGAPELPGRPWLGLIRRPVMPGPDGHFDHLPVGSREFEAAHAYGVIRFVLDAWEPYFSHPIPWPFARHYERLEISLFPALDNARAGYGFIELGSHFTASGEALPFSLNFDVVAHELGHIIVYSEAGMPAHLAADGEYPGFNEAAADLTALVALLHFESVVRDLLELTSGNLYTFNALNRFAELSENEQIRIAGNGRKLSDFALGWSDEHDLSEPLTGAMFDILVDVFHEQLLERRLIAPEVEDLFDRLEREPGQAGIIQSLFDEAFPADPGGFEEALLDARDYLGLALARIWPRLRPDFLTYADVGDAFLEVDRELSGGRYQRAIASNFLWREIGLVRVGPRLTPPDARSHLFSPRTFVPEEGPALARMPYRERWRRAHRSRSAAR